jgi:5'-AMP-activated protein kinase regulatory beta subunit
MKMTETSYASSPDGSYTSERPAYLDLALQSHIIPGSNGAAIPSSALANEAASVRRMQPPTLPPHLDHVILNNATVSRDDDSALPAPHHVELNHLYACSIRDGVMAMATTKRYREKVSNDTN